MSSYKTPVLGDRKKPKRSAKDEAYEYISERILEGVLEEGMFLDETDLANAIGVSRTPVREALLKLQAERFIDLLPRRGAQVRSITVSEMHEVYETRIMIETTAFERICRGGKPVPEEALAILERMRVAGDHGDWSDYGQLDQRFHSLLMQAAENSVMHRLYENLRPQHVRIAIRAIKESPGRRSTIEREHKQIFHALRQRQLDEALAILREHLKEVPEVTGALD